MDQSSFGILAHNLLRAHNLVLVAHVSKYMKFKSKESINFKEMLINLRKKVSGMIHLVYEGKETGPWDLCWLKEIPLGVKFLNPGHNPLF